MNLTGDHYEIRGLRIDVSEKALGEVTGLPKIENRWFCQKRDNLTAVEDFLVAGEHV